MDIKLPFLTLIFLLALAAAADVCDQTCDPSCYTCEPIQMDADSELGVHILDYGESTNLSISAANAEPNVTIYCQYSVDFGPASVWFNITNDGSFHEMGKEVVTAPTEVVDYQVYKQVNVRVYCRSNITNATDTLWCGGGCMELFETYMYPNSTSIAEHQTKKLAASAKLFEARVILEEASGMINKARLIINSTTGQIESAKAYLKVAEEQYDNAWDYYEQASYSYESDEFDDTISYAGTSKSYGESAKQNAFLAYNSITYPSAVYYYVWSYINDTGDGGDDVEDIIDTLNDIINGPGGGGVPPEVKDGLMDALNDLENANDLLDEANRRLLDGDFAGAQSLADQARALIEQAKRKLQKIFLTLLNSLSKSLLGLYGEISGRLDLMQEPIITVMRLHGAYDWEIKAIAADMDGARRSLQRAYSLIRNMRNSEDIATLSRRGELADAAMRDVIDHMNSAMAQIQNVLFRTYIKVAAVAAVAAIVTSIVWRHRKRFEAKKKEVKLAKIVSREFLRGEKPKETKLSDLFKKR